MPAAACCASVLTVTKRIDGRLTLADRLGIRRVVLIAPDISLGIGRWDQPHVVAKLAGGSANFAAPAPAEGVRTQARLKQGDWVISGAKKWISSATGWEGAGADLLTVVWRTDPAAPPERGISIIAVPGPATGIVLERAIDSIGHRAHLLPVFRLDGLRVPQGNLIGSPGAGKDLVEGCFTGTAPIVGFFAVGLMRAAFDFALRFARTEARGGAAPIIAHQAVGNALADAKAAIEAVRSLSLPAARPAR
jgi:nitroalkane oxidase